MSRASRLFDSPFTTDVVVLTLTDPLVREKDAPDASPSLAQAAGVAIDPWDLPWALELANGDQCTLLGGTLTVMAGQTAHYGCVTAARSWGRFSTRTPSGPSTTSRKAMPPPPSSRWSPPGHRFLYHQHWKTRTAHDP